MGPDTSLRIEVSALHKTVIVNNGILTSVLRKLDKISGGSFTVKTPALVAGVRGTSFFLRVRADIDETYFCACNGRLQLETADGTQSFEQVAHHHDATIFTGTSQKTIVSKPDAGYNHGHTDKDLEDLAAKIGEKIDWTTVE